MIDTFKKKVLSGAFLNKEEALALAADPDLGALCSAADEIRRHFCGNRFSLCSIVNAKSGHCSENCKFCAQSAHFPVGTEEYPLMEGEELYSMAQNNYDRGVGRFSLVTSGRKLSQKETDSVCRSVKAIHERCQVAVCGSHGLLSYGQLRQLREAGMVRYHCNLETSRRNFPSVCTSHSYDDKIETLKNAMAAGMHVCSGGIIGMGESMEDRIDVAMDLQALGILSVPINVLTPIPGTPYGHLDAITNEEVLRTVAVFRFLLPKADIRMAAGRGRFADQGRTLFSSGANAAITGDMLTTAGISIETDLAMLAEIGYEVER